MAAAREPIERAPSMYLQVAQKIATDIRRGRYQPGEVLPSESAMVEMYGVGKHTVRSAIAELRRMGLAESQQGKGSIVLPTGGVLPATRVERSIQRTSKEVGTCPRPRRQSRPPSAVPHWRGPRHFCWASRTKTPSVLTA